MLNKLFSAFGMVFTGLVLRYRMANFAQSEELKDCEELYCVPH